MTISRFDALSAGFLALMILTGCVETEQVVLIVPKAEMSQ